MEVTGGAELLSERTEEERHLGGKFRLSCRTRVAASIGEVHCHTMRRGAMRIETESAGLPVGLQGIGLDPAVVRDGERVLLDGEEIERAAGSALRHRDGPGHHHRGAAPVRPGNRRADRRHVVRKSAALRRLRRDVAHRLRHRASGQTVAAHAGRLSEPRDRRISGRSPQRSTRWWWWATPPCAICSFGQNVYSIGQSPYRSITEIEMAAGKRTTTSLAETGRRCLLPIHPKARVYGVPIISGHVGADAAACLLAVDLAHEDRLIAIMDIGTNTELIVGQPPSHSGGVLPGGAGLRGRRHRLRHAGAGWRDRRRDGRRRRAVFNCA